MDVTRWKSLAIKKPTHEAVLILSGKYMGPGTYVEKLVDEDIERIAKKEGISSEDWKKKHLKTKEILIKKRKRS
jgi:hypothetical protein